MNVSPTSQLTYYRQNQFNPVPLALEEGTAFDSYFAIRRNLYQHHLGIPLSLLNQRSVLEFGPNTGENALVLASMGANLTMVEPNGQVLPQLRALFQRFALQNRVVDLLEQEIREFETEARFDLILAEGFLSTLPDRDEMIGKMAGLLAPGGLAVVSYLDRIGSLLEITKRMLLWRACELAGIDDTQSVPCLEMAKRLFWEDFSTLEGSRPFEVWWKDMLVSPYVSTETHWGVPELLSLMEQHGCEFYSSSPKWLSVDFHQWYKKIASSQERHQVLLENWARTLPFFLTGAAPADAASTPASEEVIRGVNNLVIFLSDYSQSGADLAIQGLPYPPALDDYLVGSGSPMLSALNQDLKQIYRASVSGSLDDLLTTYHDSDIRRLWGTPCHYFCFTKAS